MLSAVKKQADTLLSAPVGLERGTEEILELYLESEWSGRAAADTDDSDVTRLAAICSEERRQLSASLGNLLQSQPDDSLQR